MPLYELLLNYPDRSEVRLTDDPIAVGDRLEIAGDQWEVVLEREPEDVPATARFLCELALSQRQRAARASAQDREMRERMAKLQTRIDRPRPPRRGR